MARIVVQRTLALEAAGDNADVAEVFWAFIKIMGPVLDRELKERDSAVASALAAEWEKDDALSVDTSVIISGLLSTFPCN